MVLYCFCEFKRPLEVDSVVPQLTRTGLYVTDPELEGWQKSEDHCHEKQLWSVHKSCCSLIEYKYGDGCGCNVFYVKFPEDEGRISQSNFDGQLADVSNYMSLTYLSVEWFIIFHFFLCVWPQICCCGWIRNCEGIISLPNL